MSMAKCNGKAIFVCLVFVEHGLKLLYCLNHRWGGEIWFPVFSSLELTIGTVVASSIEVATDNVNTKLERRVGHVV
jgi:hypothetical protein